MLNWLKSSSGVPNPSGPPKTIRRFHTSDATVSRDSIPSRKIAGLLIRRKTRQSGYSRFQTLTLSNASSLTEQR